ncbi:GntR family transcriptional regulator [Parasphingorhabdus sp.]|uniref:GntR family transcriptional regulator n=1 Tax=Parasphingorhabdus sp. TaxID=2709688 RepID=UPI0032ECD451
MKASLSTVDSFAETLREAVRQGDLSPGQRLVEADLTEKYGISRGSLREAIRRLAAEGLVELYHNKGARITQLSSREIRGLYAVREALETLAAQLAAECISKSGRKKLESLMRTADKAVDQGDAERYIELNEQFHETIVEQSANPTLIQLIKQLHTPVLRYQLRSFMNSSVLWRSHEDHKKISSAIYAGNSSAARRAMQAHIRRSSKLADRTF